MHIKFEKQHHFTSWNSEKFDSLQDEKDLGRHLPLCVSSLLETGSSATLIETRFRNPRNLQSFLISHYSTD